jgi:ABC-2 type transport system ATP-binding protein
MTDIAQHNARASSATAAIEAVGLEKTFSARGRKVKAVDGLSFAVAEGEIFGLLGPNGAGKTTTMRMLTTLLPIDAGRATIAGIDVAAEPARVRRHLGYVSQAGGADLLATGEENLALQGALYGMNRSQLAARVPEVLGLLDLEQIATRRVKTYSGGQRRRLDVALGIVHQPEVLFLDEPSTGLDPQNRANLWDHIGNLASSGTTVVLTTHYLEEADALCERVIIVDGGRIVAAGTPASLKAGVAGASVTLTFRDPDQATRAAGQLGLIGGISDLSIDAAAVRLHAQGGAGLVPELLRSLDAAGSPVTSLAFSEASLDDVFLAATGRSLRDTTSSPTTNPSTAKAPA